MVVGGLVGGGDETDLGCRGESSKAELVGKAVLAKGEFDGRDGKDVMCSFGRSGAK